MPRPSLSQHHREKLLNAILFFVRNTQNCRKTKLLKLLYFLDFGHFRETGRSVTGLGYEAWKLGPVARTVYKEIGDRPPEDLQTYVEVTSEPSEADPESYAFKITPKREFDETHFTPRELRIMGDIANRYSHKTAAQMTDETHAEGSPWHRVYEAEGRPDGEIPFEYILEGEEKESKALIEERAHEHKDVIRNYS